MILHRWLSDAEDSRRITAAQFAVWIAGAAPVLALVYVFAEIALGHPDERSRISITPLQIAGGAVWLVLCATGGILIGRRRPIGLYLSALLLLAVAVAGALQQRFDLISVVSALIGLGVLVRARRAVRASAS